MYSFIIALALLVLGYIIYGGFITRVFGPDERKTPCYTHNDGVDYLPMPTWKVFMIQFLNIAGVGPIFGAIMGAQFGTASYLWIVFGTIFAGATHDYLAAMISMRKDGASLPDIVGEYLGRNMRILMSAITVLLLILVGAVFTSSPAGILSSMTKNLFPEHLSWINSYGWLVLIFAYYIIATLCPVDKIIGKIYPYFAVCLIFMAIGILGKLLILHPSMPEMWDNGAFVNKAWSTNPVFPMMFISIACGAISGFHATQSPMMARCIKHERLGRPCFYGAMVTEGIVALVWAAAATWFFSQHGTVSENGTVYDGATVATLISRDWLGVIGGILALLGIAIAPISTGDTAMRSCRLIVADALKLEQHSMRSRLAISIPLFAITAAILLWSMNDKDGFGVLWRYFGWMNQTLSVFTLWTVSVYLKRHGKLFWVTLVPAMFMTVVCSTFILSLKSGGLGLPVALSSALGIALSIIFAVFFFSRAKIKN